MLSRLFIKNIALISKLEVEFAPGLNILTGETGAGKSIIIDAINLALGERAEYGLIKHGETKASVEAEFELTDSSAVHGALRDLEIESEDGYMIVSRELTSAGRSVCRINGTVVSQTALKSVMDLMVDVHGQHEHQSLLSPKHHLGYLDEYAKETVSPILEKVAKAYDSFKSLEKEMKKSFLSPEERERKIDTLTYQINEIEALNIKPGEDEELSRTRDLLMNSEHIASALQNAYDGIYGGDVTAMSLLRASLGELSSIADLSENYASLSERCDEVFYALEDIALSIRQEKDGSTFEISDLEQVEERLNTLNGLKRKYGGTTEDVLKFLESAKTELDEILSGEEQAAKKAALLEKHKNDYYKYSEELTTARRAAAEKFSKEVVAELSDLGLKGAKLSVEFGVDDSPIPSRNGVDKAEFMLSANAGEPEKPLSRVASGGEISRIMLALKTVLSHVEGVQTMIFDEIDTGISGNTAFVVGEKMHNIAANKQVLAITHLPQIAAFADVHFLVEKTEDNGSTHSRLRLLDDTEHTEEIARIMGGADSPAALEHSAVMIKNAMSKISK